MNVATKSGTNSIHGEAFGLFRDNSQAAAYPGGANSSAASTAETSAERSSKTSCSILSTAKDYWLTMRAAYW